MITELQQPKETETQRRWIKPREWREVTGMSHGATYALIREGEIRAVQVGERYYIPISELNDFFERHAERAA